MKRILIGFFLVFVGLPIISIVNAQPPDFCRECTEIRVEINHLHATSRDSCNGKMDFYARVNLYDSAKQVIRKFKTNVWEGNDLSNIFASWLWSFSGYSNGFHSVVYAAIDIQDDDDFFCGGGDDRVDVSLGEEQVLILAVDVDKGSVYALQDHIWVYKGKTGQVLQSEGYIGRETGRIVYKITAHYKTN